MPSRLLQAAARVARPWRNGGGVTRDVVVFPRGAGDKDFLWRASVATIGAAGPFSAWPGVDRTLLLLRGELVIALDGGAEQRLRPGDAAIAFPGEAAVAARPVAGECTVLNLMVRRGQMRARLERRDAARPTSADRVLLVAEAATTIRLDGRSLGLGMDDALLLDRAQIATLECDRAVIVVELFDEPN